MKRLKRIIAKKILNYVFMDRESGLQELIEQNINQRTQVNIIRWLDFKRILHCSYCIDTEQLLRIGNQYVCKKHTAQVPVKEAVNA